MAHTSCKVDTIINTHMSKLPFPEKFFAATTKTTGYLPF